MNVPDEFCNLQLDQKVQLGLDPLVCEMVIQCQDAEEIVLGECF